MIRLDTYSRTGYALDLLAASPYHSQLLAVEYFLDEIFPAFSYKQYKFYVDSDGKPYGMVTWAWIDQKVQEDVTKSGRALQFHEWKCGEKLFFNDWIAPYGRVREIVSDLKTNVFGDQKVASSIRRTIDSKVRKVNRWSQ